MRICPVKVNVCNFHCANDLWIILAPPTVRCCALRRSKLEQMMEVQSIRPANRALPLGALSLLLVLHDVVSFYLAVRLKEDIQEKSQLGPTLI